MFHDLAMELKSNLKLQNIGMVVSHRRAFEEFKNSTPNNQLKNFSVLKEWEITNSHHKVQVDSNIIAEYEKTLQVPSFGHALIVDRRINHGKKCTYYQDYPPRFSSHEQFQILQHSLIEVERLFDEVKPDFIVSFICVTLVEYLCNLFAKSRGIKVLNIRPTRIGNYMAFGNDITEPSNMIRDKFLSLNRVNPETNYYQEAYKIFNESTTRNYTYEGISTIKPTNRKTKIFKYLINSVKLYKILNLIINDIKITYGSLKDNHDPGILKPLYYEMFYKPLLKVQLNKKLNRKYIQISELENQKYVFFPLHTEPEKALLVDAPFFTNQIEVIKNIAQSLPTGTRLIIKDHPKSYAKRPSSYYTKILNIPNVTLVDPLAPTFELVKHSQLVLTIAGSVGWEALLHKKPVIILGNTPYEFLPESMVTKTGDIASLPHIIKKSITNYKFDEEAIIKYLIATISESIPLNYYSVLLSRSNVNSRWSLDADWNSEISKLAKYTELSLAK